MFLRLTMIVTNLGFAFVLLGTCDSVLTHGIDQIKTQDLIYTNLE